MQRNLNSAKQTHIALSNLVEIGNQLPGSSTQSSLRKIKRLQTKIRRKLAKRSSEEGLQALAACKSVRSSLYVGAYPNKNSAKLENRFGFNTAVENLLRITVARLSPTCYQITFQKNANEFFKLILEYFGLFNQEEAWKMATNTFPDGFGSNRWSMPMSERQWESTFHEISDMLTVLDLRRQYLEKLLNHFESDLAFISSDECDSRVRLFIQPISDIEISESTVDITNIPPISGYVEFNFSDFDSHLPSMIECYSTHHSKHTRILRYNARDEMPEEAETKFTPWSSGTIAFESHCKFLEKSISLVRDSEF